MLAGRGCTGDVTELMYPFLPVTVEVWVETSCQIDGRRLTVGGAVATTDSVD